MAMDKKFRERDLMKIAVFSIVGMLLAIAGSFQLAKLPFISGATYSAQFAELGGLKNGDPVQVAGVQVGKVTDLDLDGSHVTVTFTAKHVDLGKETRASIKTGTLLGARFVALEPDGEGTLASGATIPLSRTTAPYDLSADLTDIAGHTREIDLDSVANAMRTFSATIEQSTDEFGPAFTAVTDIATAVNTRDAALRQLFKRAEHVTGTFQERTKQITQLISDGSKILQELQLRRQVLSRLIRNASAVADQVSGLVRDNRSTLKPALGQLTRLLSVLRTNQDNLQVAIKRAAAFITGLGEGVASGPYFTGHLDLAPGLAGASQVPGVAQLIDPSAALGGSTSKSSGNKEGR